MSQKKMTEMFQWNKNSPQSLYSFMKRPLRWSHQCGQCPRKMKMNLLLNRMHFLTCYNKLQVLLLMCSKF